jgi:branched-chain amino acid transport system substrate-binding protein
VTLGDLNDDLYAWGQAAGFTAEFCALGGKIVKRIWIPPATTDFSGVVAQIPPAGVDGIVAATRPETVVALAKGVRQLRGNISRKLFGSGILIYERLGPLGNRVRGLVSSGPFVVAASPALTKHRKDFARAFRRLRGFAGNVFDVFYFDAMNATLKALDTVHGDLSEGERRFMAALGDVELDSAYGHIALDSRHQAVAPNYLARRTGVGAKVPTLPAFRTVPDVERTFGGYFKPTDPPPSRTAPACVKRTPPPWAR